MLHPFVMLLELMSSQYSLHKYFHLESQVGTIDNTETHCFAIQVLRHHTCCSSITHCWSWLSPADNQTCFAWEPKKYGRFSLFLSALLNISQVHDHCYPQSQPHCYHCHCIYQNTLTFISVLRSPSPLTWSSFKDSKFVPQNTQAYSIGNNTCLARPNYQDSCEWIEIKMSCYTLCRWPLILLLGFLSLSFKNDSKKPPK